jgi:hypothetical protein
MLAAAALAASLVAVPGAAHAHLAGTVYYPVYRHIASYDCTGIFKDVPDLSETPAMFECDATVTDYDVLCQDVCGKTKRLNESNQCIEQSASDLLTTEDTNDACNAEDAFAQDAANGSCVEVCHVPPGNPSNAHTICVGAPAVKAHLKNHGDSLGACEPDQCLVSKTIKLSQTVLEAAEDVCSDLGNKWSLKRELVKSAQVRLKSYECTDESCDGRRQAYEAVLNCTLPVKYDIVKNMPVDGVGTPYDCVVVAEAHCDVGDACPIDVGDVCE